MVVCLCVCGFVQDVGCDESETPTPTKLDEAQAQSQTQMETQIVQEASAPLPLPQPARFGDPAWRREDVNGAPLEIFQNLDLQDQAPLVNPKRTNSTQVENPGDDEPLIIRTPTGNAPRTPTVAPFTPRTPAPTTPTPISGGAYVDASNLEIWHGSKRKVIGKYLGPFCHMHT